MCRQMSMDQQQHPNQVRLPQMLNPLQQQQHHHHQHQQQLEQQHQNQHQ